jgi:hypothetical protein
MLHVLGGGWSFDRRASVGGVGGNRVIPVGGVWEVWEETESYAWEGRGSFFRESDALILSLKGCLPGNSSSSSLSALCFLAVSCGELSDITSAIKIALVISPDHFSFGITCKENLPHLPQAVGNFHSCSVFLDLVCFCQRTGRFARGTRHHS